MEGRERYPVRVRYPRELRGGLEDLETESFRRGCHFRSGCLVFGCEDVQKIVRERPFFLLRTLKKRDQHHLAMQLRVHDYLPHALKMALKTKDHRYLALFDPETAGRKLFDDETGKSLS